jgi:hypothetical protein
MFNNRREMLKFHLGCDDTLCSGGKQCWARQFNCTPAALCPPNMPLCVVLPNLWMTNILPGRSLPGSFRSASQRDSLWTDLPGCWKTFELHRWHVRRPGVQMQTGHYRLVFLIPFTHKKHKLQGFYRNTNGQCVAAEQCQKWLTIDWLINGLVDWVMDWCQKN